MAIDIHAFEKKKLLEKFLEAKGMKLISDITITDCEFGIPLKMKGDSQVFMNETFIAFNEAKFTVSGMYSYSKGAVVTEEPHMFVYVMRDSEFFNTEKLVESETGLCGFYKDGNLKICKDMMEKINEDIHSSDYWKRFSAVFEDRTLKHIKMGYTKLKYCPFCGGKTLREFTRDGERSIEDEIEIRR